MEEQLNQSGGFDHSLTARNEMLKKKGMKEPISIKTGTTIAGLIFKDGIVLGADTRATEGPIVCDKNCEKIHYLADNIYCGGAGTSADIESTILLIASKLELLRLATGTQPRVISAVTRLKQYLFPYGGYVSAALIIGGVDPMGPHLHSVHPHGSTDSLPYTTMGSGSLAAMSVFETGYEEDMNQQQAMDLVENAIKAGVFDDLGSGGNIDLKVIKKDGVEHFRNYRKPNERLYRRKLGYRYPIGTVDVISTTIDKSDS